MTAKAQLTLEQVLRVAVSIGLVLSMLSTPAFVPLAQAKTTVARPVSDPQPEVTLVVETTTTPKPTPVVESVTPEPVTVKEKPTSPEPVWQLLLERAKVDVQPMGMAVEAGTQLTTTDGRVKLEFPANALAGAAEVSYGLRHTQVVTEPERTTSLIEFDLEAARTDAIGQTEAVTHFKQPLTLTVNLKGLLDLERVPEGYYVYLYTVTPEGYQNPVWPIYTDHKAGTISAQVDHFSGWGAGIAPGAPGVWEFNYTAPEVALYPGAATAQIPLKVPAGRGGLQPNLSLSYNSATLNGLTGAVRGTRDWTRGGELGGFWQLDGTAKIAREKWDTCMWRFWGNVEKDWIVNDASCMQDVFTLILGGTGYDLTPAVPGQTYGQYYAVGGPDIYIYRKNWCLAHDTNDGECTTYDPNRDTTVPNVAKEYWIVRTPDGTAIRFGYNPDSEQLTGNVCNPHWWGAETCRKGDTGVYGMGYKGESRYPAAGNDTTPYQVPRAWWADKWTDQSGNTMEASYYTYWYDNGERVTPYEIKYNSVAGGYLSRVQFVGVAGVGPTGQQSGTPPDNEPTIDRVETYTKGSDNNEYLVRKYLFTRQVNNKPKWVGNCASTCGAVPGNTCGSGGTCQSGVDYGDIPSYFEILASVQEESGNGVRLPAQTFGYEWRKTRGWNDIMQLTSVNNGYGAVTTFAYAPVGGTYCAFDGCNDYAVSSRKVSPGSGTPDMFSTYDYAQACFDAAWGGGTFSPCASRATLLCGDACDKDRFIKLAGFGEATVTSWSDVAMTTALARSKHYFKNANPSYFLGKEYKVQTLDPANNNAVLAVQDTTWSGASNGIVWWAYVADQTITRFSGGIGDSTRKSYYVGNYNEVGSEYDYGAGLRVLNAGFDIDTGSLANWTTYYGGSLITPTATGETSAFAGRYVLKLSGNNTGGVYQDVSGLVPGATYKARVRVKWSSPTATGTFRLRLHDTIADPNPNNSQSSSMPNPGDGNWKTVEVTYLADWTGAVRLHMDYQVVSDGSIYVDEVELARAEDIGDEKSAHFGYVYNEASNEWIIAKNNWKNDYEGIIQNVGGTSLKFQTFLYYDGATVYNAQTPTQGRLTKVQEGLNTTWRSVQYGYDSYGNTTSITDAEGRVSTAEYDTNQYNYFVMRVARSGTNPVQQRTYTWDKVLGVMLTQTGPDGAVTSYASDTFGRLKKVAQTPDTLTYPTVEYAYYDGGDKPRNSDANGNPVWPLMIATLYRAQAGVAACSGGWGGWERKFIDGLGRVVESQGPGPNWDCTNSTQQGKEVNQYTLYNALGQAVESSVPYYVPQYVSQSINGYILTPYRTPDLSQARSKTVYDILGAEVRSYGTDGSFGTTLNINRLGVTEGAIGQIGLGFTDGRGLVTAVDQTMADWSDDFSDDVLAGWTQVGASESGGTARISGNGTDWANRIYRGSLSDGKGIAFSFKSDGNNSSLQLDTGTVGQSNYWRWSLYHDASTVYLRAYEGTATQSSALLPFKTNTWYRAVLKVGGNGEFVAAVWERDNPAASAVRREKRGAAWANRAWQFTATSKAGSLLLDDYAELSFKTTRYSYDTVGNLTNIWDMTGNNIMQIGYDTYRRRTSMYDKDMGTWSYVYNKVDTLTAQQDSNGQWTCFYADNLDRVTGVKYMTGATNPCAGQTVYDATYGYDTDGDVGYRTWARNANAVTTWAYDERGRVTSERKTITNGGGPYVTSFTYDSMNRVKSVTYPSGEVVNSNYYAYRPQLSSMSSAASPSGYNMNYVSNIVYDAQGRVTSQTKGNGLAEAWLYDPLNGKLIQHTVGSLLDMRYGYDPVGNVRAVHDAIRHDGTSETVRYQYDDLERLTGYGTRTTLGTITVRAKGTNNNGWPVMQLRVNGVKVSEWTVNATSYTDYQAQVPLSGDDWIDVVYTNDAGTRDLYVDYAVVDGTTVQAENTAQVVYDRGSGLLREALDGLDVIAGQETMAWPGALRMRIKNAWTPAAADAFSYDDTGNLTMGTESRTYGTTPVGTCVAPAATLPHAVYQIGTKTFTYDCVGNMLTRPEGAGPTTYTQAWTPDNKLKSVMVNGQTTEFKYDADGNRVMRVKPDDSRTVYVSGQFEVELVPPTAPSSLAATAFSCSQINLSWADSSNEDGFKIERWWGGAEGWEQIATVDANVTSYQNTGLTRNTTYSYRVQAYNGAGDSIYSTANTTTASSCVAPEPPYGPPVNLTIVPTSTSIFLLSWEDYNSNETGFKIERSVNGGNTWTQIVTVSVNVTAYTDNYSWSCGGSPLWRVRAYNPDGDSAYSNVGSTATCQAPSAPISLAVTAWVNHRINLTWTDKSNNEQGFEIERSPNGSFWENIASVGVNDTSYMDTDLDCGAPTYYYRVRAYGAWGNSGYTGVAEATTAPACAPMFPGCLAPTAVSSSQINLSWLDNSSNEDGFKIERHAGDWNWTEIATLGANVSSYGNTGLNCSTTYYYRVQAYNAWGASEYTAGCEIPGEAEPVTTFACVPPPPAPSALGAVVTSSSQIDLNWTDNGANEDGFKIERSLDGSIWTEIATVDANVSSYSNTGLSCGTTYTYRVRAYNPGGDSAYSNTANGTPACPLLAAPSDLSAWAASSSQIGLGWTDNSTDEDTFEIEYGLDGNNWSAAGTLGMNSTGYSHTGLSCNTAYYYRVRACNGNGCSSYNTLTNTVTTAACPTATPLPPSLGEAVDNTGLSWSTSGNASWGGQTGVSYSGGDAAESGAIGNYQSTSLTTTVSGPGTLTFWWMVSSEANADFLTFYIDGVPQAGQISGEVAWTQQSYNIASGVHTLTWTYAKDWLEAVGGDAGWVDLVVFTLQPTPTHTPTPTPTPGSSGLVLALGFNEGNGTTVADASGNSNTGTLNGATWTTSGKYGKALLFDGTNDWVTVNDANSLDLVNGMTLEAWVYPTALGTSWRTVIIKEQAFDLIYALYAHDGGSQRQGIIYSSDAEHVVASTTALPLNTWTHLATTYDGSTLKLYLNGTQIASTSYSGQIITSDHPLRVGGNQIPNWGEYFAGRIDEVRVYNRALSQAEIQTDMNTALGGSPTPTPTNTPVPPIPTNTPTPGSSGLVLALGFNEGNGTTVADASGNSNTGTLNGATWTTSGKYGKALLFDGTNDWVTVNDANSLDLVNGMTLEAWVYPTTLNSSWRTIMMKESDAYYYLYADGNTGQGPGVGVNIGGYKEIYSASDLTLNAWSHVAGTWDGSTLRLYVNGSQVATLSQSGSLTNSSDPLRIGGNALWGEYFAGRIDEVRVYNRALSQAEIQTDMNTAVASASVLYVDGSRAAGLAAPAQSETQTKSLWKRLNDLLTRVWGDIATYAPPARVALAPMQAMSTPSNGVTWRTYYGGAVREKTATTDYLYYVYADALSSASLTTNNTGGWAGEQRYKPFGEPRAGFPQGDLHTDYRFTGQRSEEASLGSLYDYGARFYSPAIGRFISPDSIVPGPTNSQDYNRYSYVRNNPIKYTDPSGHEAYCGNNCRDLFAGAKAKGISEDDINPALINWMMVIDGALRDGIGAYSAKDVQMFLNGMMVDPTTEVIETIGEGINATASVQFRSLRGVGDLLTSIGESLGLVFSTEIDSHVPGFVPVASTADGVIGLLGGLKIFHSKAGKGFEVKISNAFRNMKEGNFTPGLYTTLEWVFTNPHASEIDELPGVYHMTDYLITELGLGTAAGYAINQFATAAGANPLAIVFVPVGYVMGQIFSGVDDIKLFGSGPDLIGANPSRATAIWGQTPYTGSIDWILERCERGGWQGSACQ